MWTYCQFITFTNFSQIRSYRVIPVEEAYEVYQETQCGFGGNYDTPQEAEEAAWAWMDEEAPWLP